MVSQVSKEHGFFPCKGIEGNLKSLIAPVVHETFGVKDKMG